MVGITGETNVNNGNNGRRGENLAALLWPDLKLVAGGGEEDRNGTDGYTFFGQLYSKPVQIKYDSTIVKTMNIEHELYEKTAGHPEQKWRISRVKADWYIFITESNTEAIGFKISINDLANAEVNKTLRALRVNGFPSPTSIGFLIPLREILNKEERRFVTNTRGDTVQWHIDKQGTLL
jgi:hypothetical protein